MTFNFIQWLRPGTVLLVSWFLVSLFYIHGVAAEGIFSAIDFPATTAEPNLMSSIISRDVNGNLILKKAAMIFQEKLAQSDILQEAALDLIHNCKAAKEAYDGKFAHKEIDMAKKLYAIRATLVDLTSASVGHPATCSGLTGTRRDTWYSLWRSSKGNGQAQQGAINGCVKSLFDNSSSWTSFKTHGQDANTLCDVPGTDNAVRMIMELLNNVNSIIPDWLNAFHHEQEESAKLLERRREILENIIELEQQLKQERLQDQQDTKAHTSEMLAQIDTRFASLMREADAGVVHMDTDITRLRQNLAEFGQGMETVQHNSEDLQVTFRDAILEALTIQKQGINDINEAAGTAIASYQDANAETLSQSEAFADLVQAGMQQVALHQQQLLENAREFNQLQQETLMQQKESLAFAKKLSAAVANVAGVFEKAGPALQRLADTFSDLLTRVIIVGVCMMIVLHQAIFHSVLRGIAIFCLFLSAWYFYQTILELGTSARAYLGPCNFDAALAQDTIPSLGWVLASTIALALVLLVIVRIYCACRGRLMREDLEEHFDKYGKSRGELERGGRGMTAPP